MEPRCYNGKIMKSIKNRTFCLLILSERRGKNKGRKLLEEWGSVFVRSGKMKNGKVETWNSTMLSHEGNSSTFFFFTSVKVENLFQKNKIKCNIYLYLSA